jgi:NAD+ diphosphatase
MSEADRSTRPGEVVFAFVGTRLVLVETSAGPRPPSFDELREAVGPETLTSGRVPGRIPGPSGSVTAFALPDDLELPGDFRLDGLRVAYHAIGLADFRAAGAARQTVEWYRTHRFCSRCGTPTTFAEGHQAMRCPACEQMHFPRVAPAVIVLVQRGREALLGRSAHFRPGVFSTLAGFVEPGESLEECVHREIAEEVGVRVEGLRYFGSQPHPFPNSLMVGFVADWLDGDIRIDPSEIEDARWFDVDALPELPHPMSIARALIEDFVERVRG